MQILSASEMKETDQHTTAEFGVPSLTLMTNAGTAVARFILRRYPQAQRILVLCGKGNNGGDGFIAARILLSAGRGVRVLLLAEPEVLSGDAAAAYAELYAVLRPQLRPDGEYEPLLYASDAAALESATITSAIEEADLLVDAVLGTGFAPPLRELPALLRDRIAESSASVVSVDLPSGWDADSTALASAEAYRSDAVVTFTAPKQAHVFGNLTRGPIVVAGIGSPDSAIQSGLQMRWAGSAKSVTESPRAVNSNKGRFGHVLVIGGSGGAAGGKAGAPAMASLAALRSGAGLVTALVPSAIAATVAGFAPELMIEAAGASKNLTVMEQHITPRYLRPNLLNQLLDKKSVLAVGPGLSREPETAAFVRGLVAATTLPMVLDADGLNAFEGKAGLLDGRKRALVLTPHPGEMARLVGCSIADVEADRIGLARGFATKHHLTLVLKGWRTLIAHPDGRIAVNTSGNAAMAKGGSGDLLTGIVAALLAQYPQNVAEAVEAAVYLHGLAGDYAVKCQDEHTVLATDLLAHLWQAFRHRAMDGNGFVWITGASS